MWNSTNASNFKLQEIKISLQMQNSGHIPVSYVIVAYADNHQYTWSTTDLSRAKATSHIMEARSVIEAGQARELEAADMQNVVNTAM